MQYKFRFLSPPPPPFFHTILLTRTNRQYCAAQLKKTPLFRCLPPQEYNVKRNENRPGRLPKAAHASPPPLLFPYRSSIALCSRDRGTAGQPMGNGSAWGGTIGTAQDKPPCGIQLSLPYPQKPIEPIPRPDRVYQTMLEDCHYAFMEGKKYTQIRLLCSKRKHFIPREQSWQNN